VTTCPGRRRTGIPRRVRRWRVPGARHLVRPKRGRSFHPGLHYYVGGNSKVYGAALFRLRERDFGEVVHQHGISPAWPLRYGDFEPFYTEAERLFAVHGQRGEDPLSRRRAGHIRIPPVSHEPRIQALSDNWPLTACTLSICRSASGSTSATASATPTSICIRCDAFDGFPCLLNGKADAQVMCVDPDACGVPECEL
jgi:choline dehydrogenase-like flavoprotein